MAHPSLLPGRGRPLATAVAVAALAIAAAAPGAYAASRDPVFAGAVANQHPPSSGNFNFSVNFEGGTYNFPASLTLHRSTLGGTVTAPSGCVASVNAGSTDKHGKLSLQVTFGGACNGEPGSFVGTLKFRKGTGTGTFTDPYASGPYVASKA